MQRLRSFRASILRSTRTPELKKKALNSLSAVQDTYYSTKDTFERHRVVFTVGTSIASVATAWIGYTLRHLHDTRVDRRLDSIEQAQMQKNHYIEQDEIKKIVSSGNVSTSACVATAGTSLVVGYALGWRGGKWYATRKFRREQMKLLGQIEPRKLRFQFIRKPFKRLKFQETVANRLASLRKAKPIPESSTGQIRNPC